MILLDTLSIINKENLEILAEFIGKNLVTVILILAILGGATWLIISKIPPIIDALSYKNNLKFKNIEEILTKTILTPMEQKAIKEQLADDYFAKSTGIRLSYLARQKILSIKEDSKGVITLYTIKKSQIYLRYENEKLIVAVGKLEKFVQIFSVIVAIIVFLMGLGMMGLTIFYLREIIAKFDVSDFKHWVAISIWILSIFSSFFISFTFISTAQEIKYAIKIKNYLNPPMNTTKKLTN